jgi:hypothetical protein
VRVRFLADADLNQAIVGGVLRREPSLDFLTARAGALRGLPDIEVLELAASAAAGAGFARCRHNAVPLSHFQECWKS